MNNATRILIARLAGPISGLLLVAALALSPVGHLAHAATAPGVASLAGAATVPSGPCGGAGCEMVVRCRGAQARFLGLAAHQPQDPDPPGFAVLPASMLTGARAGSPAAPPAPPAHALRARDLFALTERLRL